METDTARALPSHGIFTCALPDGLRYVSAGDLRDSFLAEPVVRIEALERKLDTLLETDDSSAIENFREILGFLEGLTDDERLATRLADIGRRLDETQGVAAGSIGTLDVSATEDTVELTVTLNDGGEETVPFPIATEAQAGAVTATQVAMIADAPERAFRELWKSAGCSIKEDADPSEMYVCNGLGMSYAEARAVYAAGVMTNDNRNLMYATRNIRTHLPSHIGYSVSGGERTFIGSKVEVVNAPLFTSGVDCFNNCQKLRSIRVYSPNVSNAYYANTYRWCYALEELRVSTVYARNIWLGHSPLLSLASVQDIIAKTQAGMAAFVVTVHPDVYAKMTGDTTNEAAAALTQEELAKWAQLLSDAAEKEITFTIPN